MAVVERADAAEVARWAPPFYSRVANRRSWNLGWALLRVHRERQAHSPISLACPNVDTESHMCKP